MIWTKLTLPYIQNKQSLFIFIFIFFFTCIKYLFIVALKTLNTLLPRNIKYAWNTVLTSSLPQMRSLIVFHSNWFLRRRLFLKKILADWFQRRKKNKNVFSKISYVKIQTPIVTPPYPECHDFHNFKLRYLKNTRFSFPLADWFLGKRFFF